MPSLKSAPITELLRARGKIDQVLGRYLKKQRAEFADQRINGALFDDLAEFALRPGKRIRPLLFLAGCRLFGATERHRATDLYQVAISLELLHAFILVHDDIIDQSALRRGSPTLHRVLSGRVSAYTDQGRAGHDLALVLGDILFALAQMAVVESHLPFEIRTRLIKQQLAYTVQTGFGETADILFGLRDISKIELPDIEQMYLAKTTRYTFEAPLCLAAIASGLELEQKESLAGIVEPAGFAFQILNDLDEFERFEVADIASSDMLDGKKTVLLQTTFQRLTESDRTLLQMCLSGAPGREASATMIRDLVLRSGAIQLLRDEVGALFDETQRRIDAATLPEGAAEGLRQILDAIANLLTSGATKRVVA